MKVSSSGYKVLYKRQSKARMFKREIRKFLMAGTLTAMITTVKIDGL